VENLNLPNHPRPLRHRDFTRLQSEANPSRIKNEYRPLSHRREVDDGRAKVSREDVECLTVAFVQGVECVGNAALGAVRKPGAPNASAVKATARGYAGEELPGACLKVLLL
jgi:hypothetical protein